MLPGYTPAGIPQHRPKAGRMDFKHGRMYVENVHTAFNGLPRIDLEDLQMQKTLDLTTPRTAISHEERRSARESARSSYRPATEPDWLKNDKRVLRFFAYFREHLHEDPRESQIIRKCNICFYLEDGSIMVSEPKMRNSGRMQGALVKRHRVPLPGCEMPNGSGRLDTSKMHYFVAEDFDIGSCVTMYSRTYRIYDCDDFTREWFRKKGTELQAAEEVPEDLAMLSARTGPRAVDPERLAENMRIRQYYDTLFGGGQKNTGLSQYLEKDRQVLRFHCIWDDPSLYGVRSFFLLHYYLADDTIEVRQAPLPDIKKEWSVFFTRSKLSKNPHMNPAPGMISPKPCYYQPEDLQVGGTITVTGRELFLYDCDDFTRQFYLREHYFEQNRLEVSAPEVPQVEPKYPPHTGLGTEEDTISNCKYLTPRPHRKNIIKLLQDSDKELKFEARMVTNIREYKPRLFRITCYIADETVFIEDITGPNSGFHMGKFFSRSRVQNPATGEWFKPQDFYLGASLEVNRFQFEITRATERTLNYMETHAADFPMADPQRVAQKIGQLADEVHETHPYMPVSQVKALAESRLGVALCEHELVALARAFARDRDAGSRGEWSTSDPEINMAKIMLWKD
jgi:hypothetical protein